MGFFKTDAQKELDLIREVHALEIKNLNWEIGDLKRKLKDSENKHRDFVSQVRSGEKFYMGSLYDIGTYYKCIRLEIEDYAADTGLLRLAERVKKLEIAKAEKLRK